MNQNEEDYFVLGQRSSLRSILRHILREMGADDPIAVAAQAIAEREEIVTALREVCAEYGDNDWPNDLPLADVIQQHLAKHLDEEAESM